MTRDDLPAAHLDDRDDRVDEAVRERLLALLAEVGRSAPYMRLGQLVCMLTGRAEAAAPDSVYDIEDAELLAAAQEVAASRHLRSAG